MANITQLKEKARAFEQREQWQSALSVYESLIAEHAEGDDTDVGIWNRIGDLHMRLAQREEAVGAYERAVQAYADAGLHNNAIALCNKILRIVPGRPGIYLKLGVISSTKGFLADARHHLGVFVEKMQAAGQIDAAFETLAQQADAHADDPEIRRFLVEQLRAGGRETQAFEQLSKLEAADRNRGNHGEMELHGEAFQPRELDSVSPAVPADDDEDTAESDAPLGFEINSPTSDLDFQTTPQEDGLEIAPLTDGIDEAGDEPELFGITPLEGFEATHPENSAILHGSGNDEDDDDDISSFGELELIIPEGLEPPRGAAGVESGLDEEEDPDPLPLISFEVDAGADAGADLLDMDGSDLDIVAPADGLLPAEGEGEEDRDALPLLDFQLPAADPHEAPGEDEEVEAIPLLGLDQEPLAAAGERDEMESAVKEPREVEDEVQPPLGSVTPQPEAPAPEESEYIDLMALILEDEAPAGTTRFVVDAEAPTGDEDHDFREILARFREQVAKNIDPGDSASHYDLGVAFKEMGLFDEAISEFQAALRAGASPLSTLEMLGECFVFKGQHAVAWRVLDRAVRLSGAEEAELVGIVYWMGRCEEVLNRPDAACECYERVLSVDIRFRDAAQRLQTLR
ncbi:MAG: tetratricopeptide repeat protein [Gemmatimonadetes bacterium]|nr:tetratricopeptide repeat protein [Gemmatimonadota bacterium]